jgi:CelD/BcsL family acetyltransferase involved in cellulose biosynthesis
MIAILSAIQDKQITEEEKKNIKDNLKQVIKVVLNEFKVNQGIIDLLTNDKVVDVLYDFLLVKLINILEKKI